MPGPATGHAAAAQHQQRPPAPRPDSHVTFDDGDDADDTSVDDTAFSDDEFDDDAFSTASSSEDLAIDIEALGKSVPPVGAGATPAVPISVLTFRNIAYSVLVKQRKGDPPAGGQFPRMDSTLASIPGLPQRSFHAPAAEAQATASGGGTSAAPGGGGIGGMRQKRVRRRILTGVTGEARSGEVTAIMGASGGGKTTLLNILAQRISSGRRKGTVELDAGEGAVAVSGGMMRRVSAYVMQDDILYTSLTVRETLMYAAELRLGPQLSRRAKEDKVARLIDLLGLAKVAETLIGGERKRGVSGGERKRVAIGVEMVSDPKILYLDEPTSGLDSTNAFRVVRAIKSVAVQTASISVMVVHQPSYRVLGLIDKLLLLGVGQTAYLGPPAGLPDFLSSLGSPVPEGSNSTEHGLDVMAVLQAQGVTDIQAYAQACKAGAGNHVLAARKALEVKSDAVTPKSSMGKLVWRQPSKGQPDDEPQKTVRKEKDRPEFANGWFWELWLLTKRATVNVMRTPAQYLLRLVLILVTGLLLAILFWRPKETPEGVLIRMSFLSCAACIVFYSSCDAVPIFIEVCYTLCSLRNVQYSNANQQIMRTGLQRISWH
ncbi:hypothetical protein CLOM_g3177 [Closterium sp. NIES-68]|nr:hypothetical protein CLOM_g3177 [Closterium sp. NIES-68]GJP64652.1 hypothetical protein CLOP_g21626 [Closterium sp. NIES-67]